MTPAVRISIWAMVVVNFMSPHIVSAACRQVVTEMSQLCRQREKCDLERAFVLHSRTGERGGSVRRGVGAVGAPARSGDRAADTWPRLAAPVAVRPAVDYARCSSWPRPPPL